MAHSRGTTGSLLGAVGEVRRDPFAMLPFCGYHVGDYFAHWLAMGKSVPNPPRIFSVNWFRKSDEGKFAWPGFGENMRVLRWIVERCRNRSNAKESAVGLVPDFGDLDWTRASFDAARFADVMRVDRAQWERELAEHDALFAKVGAKRPAALGAERDRLARRLAG